MDSKTNRREFLNQSAVIVLGAVVAAQLPPGTAPAQEEYWIAKLGKVKDLNEKEPVQVKALFKDAQGTVMDEEKLFVRWQKSGRSGRWVVLSSICTHLKCKVEFDSGDSKFHCPCHGSEYDINGEVLKKPAKKDLADYSADVYEEDGMLMLKRLPS